MNLTGTVFDGRYKIGAILGSGAMGDVYRAEQLSLSRPVAVKVLRVGVAPEARARQRLEREAHVLSKLNHHAIVNIIDFGVCDDTPYLVMELVEGRSLDSLLAEGASLGPDEAAAILVELADALRHAHSVGVLHRDMKPSNILLAGPRVRLLDFGIARLLADDSPGGASNLTASGMVVGTPRYVSPEQALGLPLDPRSDLYSLGAVAYRMLAGRPPFDADTAHAILTMHATEKPVPLKDAAHLDARAAGLGAIVDRLLEKQPQDRFASAEDLVEALRAWQRRAENPQGSTSSSAPDAEARPIRESSRPGSSARSAETENLTLVFLEVEGWTDRMQRFTYAEQSTWVAAIENIAIPVAKALLGRHVKSIQETQLFAFSSPTEAVRAAMAQVDRAAQYSETAPPDMRVRFRVGIACGEVRVENRDVFGEPVNIAARIKALCAFDEILIDQAAYLAMNKAEVKSEPVGQRNLKGISWPVTIHRIVAEPTGSLVYAGRSLIPLALPALTHEKTATFAARRKTRERLVRWAVVAGAGLVVVVASWWLVVAPSGGVALSEAARHSRSLISAGKAHEAVAELESLVEGSPKDPDLHAALAHAYVAVGRKQDAVPHYYWAAKKGPKAFDDAYVVDLLRLSRGQHEGKEAANDALFLLGSRAISILAKIEASHEDSTIRARANQVRLAIEKEK